MAEAVQSLWIGDCLGPLQWLSIASFLDWGHSYQLYCYQDLEAPAGAHLCDANEILPAASVFAYPQGPECGSHAAFANLFRYKLLLERGGWWVDTDLVCLKPFTFSEPDIIGSEATAEATQVTNSAIRLSPGDPVARACYDWARQTDPATLRWGMTGPFLIDRVVREKRAQHLVKSPTVFCPVPWWHWEDLRAPNPERCTSFITGETYAVHLWHEMWRRHGVNQQMALPPTCYLQALISKHRGRMEWGKRAA